MKFTVKIISAVLGTALLMGSFGAHSNFAPQAFAQISSAKSTVDAAKTQGLVGERIDGYLGLVTDNTPANVQTAVNEINISRKSYYTKFARAKGVEVAVVARLSGEKLIAKAKSGEKTMGENGMWTTQ